MTDFPQVFDRLWPKIWKKSWSAAQKPVLCILENWNKSLRVRCIWVKLLLQTVSDISRWFISIFKNVCNKAVPSKEFWTPSSLVLYCRYSDKTRISHFYEMEKNDFIFSGLYLSHYSNLTVEILQAESRFILLIIQLIF